MAANNIQLKRSSVPGRQPDAGNVLVGEPVVNLADKIIYTKDGSGSVIVIGAGTTSNVIEGSNLYYTDARARQAISVTGDGATYNNTTGVLNITTGSASVGATGATGPAGPTGATGPAGIGEDPVAMALVFGGGGSEVPDGQMAGSSGKGYLIYNGTTKASGQLYGGTTEPTSNIRLNYDGFFYANEIYGNNMYALSDIAYKKDVAQITDGLSVINQISPVSFKWKSNDKTAYGVIAQEIEKVLPDIVASHSETKSVSYDQIIPFLVQAVKQLQTQVNVLTEKLDKAISRD